MEWFNIKDKKPNEDQEVFYFFEVLGVFAGRYKSTVWPREITGLDVDIHSDTFYGNGGWLCDDVTHWMPREVGDTELPEPPTV